MEEKRTSKKDSIKENKKHPYKKFRGLIKTFKKDIMRHANLKLKKWEKKNEIN